MNWKNILNITLVELIMTVRNTAAFALILIMPLLMVFLMGNVMKPTFDAVENGIEKFPVLYQNNDEGFVGSAFDVFITNDSIEFLDVIEAPGENIEETMFSGEYPAAIVIPKNISALQPENENLQIQVIGSGNHPIEEGAVKAVIDNFIQWINAQGALSEAILVHDPQLDEMTAANTINEILSQHGNDFIEEENLIVSTFHNLTSFQFFSASMLVFFLLTSGMGIGSSLIDDRSNKTYKRIHSFPVQKSEYLTGKIIGNGVVAVFQAISIIVITSLIFGVRWGSQPLGISLIVLLIIFISSAIGIIFSRIMNSSGALTAALTVIFWFMAFISGGFTGTPVLGYASRFTINHWAFESLTTLMTGGQLSDIIGSIMILLVTAIILWTVGLVLYNRRVSHE